MVDVLRHYEGGRESDDKLIEKYIQKSMQHWIKICENRGLEGSKIKKIGVWRCLGGSWRVLGGCCAILEDFFGDIGAKMDATWAKLEPSWQQVAPKMGHVSAKMAMLGSVWEALAEFLEYFWSILADALDIKNHLKTISFLKGFGVVGWGC